MHSHHRLVVAKGAGRNLVPHDVVEPSLDEFANVDAIFLEKLTVVDPPAHFLELSDDFRSLLRRHILSQWFTRSVVAHVRNAHPKTVGLSLIDRPLMI